MVLSIAIGAVVWLCAALTSGPPARTGTGHLPNGGVTGGAILPRFWLAAAFALPILVFLATLPASPPVFSAGHGLGSGFLIGGLASLLAILTIAHALGAAERGERVSAAAAIAGPMGLALSVAAVPPLWMPGVAVDAICGAGIGWLCAAILATCGLARTPASRTRAAASACVALAAAVGVLLCALSGLGVLHGLIDLVGKSGAHIHWSAPGLAFASCAAIVLLVATLPPAITHRIPLVTPVTGWIESGRAGDPARSAARHGWIALLCAVAMLLAGRLTAARFVEHGDILWKTKSPLLKPLFALIGPNPMFHVIGLGVVVAMLLTWMAADRSRRLATDPPAMSRPDFASAFVLVAGAMLAYQIMGGFGLGLMLVALAVYAGLFCAALLPDLHETTPTESSLSTGADLAAATPEFAVAAGMVRLLALGLVLALFRFVAARFEDDLRGVNLTDHYALFGVLFGAAMPPAVAGYLRRSSASTADSDVARLLRAITAGIIVLAVPALLIALWGTKCVLALLIGLALSSLFEASLPAALIALAGALALAQWTHHVLPLAQLTRDQKVTLVGWTTFATVIALLTAELAGRRAQAPRPAAPAPTKGGAQ
ncbi:MAG TPA: hypothetical protein VKT77_05220 [Chthonomonadaceae bacterium]|nr:hypothetical protein [Chthonomonadaceae bacterium]